MFSQGRQRVYFLSDFDKFINTFDNETETVRSYDKK